MTPVHSRIQARCQREAIAEVAKRRGVCFLDCEERFTKTRSALAHLLAHERYVMKFDSSLAEIIRKTRDILAHPDLPKTVRPTQVRQLEKDAAELQAMYREQPTTKPILREDLRIFLEVIESIYSAFDRNGYQVGSIVSREVLALANMTYNNYATYEKTLNS